MTHHRISLTFALLITVLALPTMVTAQCEPFGLGIYYADLKLPFTANVAHFPGHTGSVVMAELSPNTDGSCETQEALLKVTIPEGCTEANILLEYEGTPTGWTVNVGDSDENNGFGGDSGGPESEAELQILDDVLRVYSKAIAPATVDLLAQADLRLTDGALQIVVRSQFLSWGQPFSFIDTTNSELGFALPDTSATADEQNTFWVGVNRVVSLAFDSSRTGCGVRRVLISFR